MDAGIDLRRRVCQNPLRLDDCDQCGLQRNNCIERFNYINPLRQRCLALVNGPTFTTQQEIDDATACLGYDFINDRTKDSLRIRINVAQGIPTGNPNIDAGQGLRNTVCANPRRLDDCDICGTHKDACIARFNYIDPLRRGCRELVNIGRITTEEQLAVAEACLEYDFIGVEMKTSLVLIL
jgi:hypothetical protein